jgi:hypothetical protein
VFTRYRHWSLSWARWIRSLSSHPVKIFRCLCLYKKSKSETLCNFLWQDFFLRWGVDSPSLNTKLEEPPFRLSATAYSIYSRLPSISGGRRIHPESENVPCGCGMDPHENGFIMFDLFFIFTVTQKYSVDIFLEVGLNSFPFVKGNFRLEKFKKVNFETELCDV